jgi:hypothetical protein
MSITRREKSARTANAEKDSVEFTVRISVSALLAQRAKPSIQQVELPLQMSPNLIVNFVFIPEPQSNVSLDGAQVLRNLLVAGYLGSSW